MMYGSTFLKENFLIWQKVQGTGRDDNMQVIDRSFLFGFLIQSAYHLDLAIYIK